jgi:hypothetical protein
VPRKRGESLSFNEEIFLESYGFSESTLDLKNNNDSSLGGEEVTAVAGLDKYKPDKEKSSLQKIVDLINSQLPDPDPMVSKWVGNIVSQASKDQHLIVQSEENSKRDFIQSADLQSILAQTITDVSGQDPAFQDYMKKTITKEFLDSLGGAVYDHLQKESHPVNV